ncbi:MAG: HrpE/YscL family type III secretion apparatus protein [Chlamydiota bacterium]
MKTLESGQDKVKHICDMLRKETLDPAKQEAAKIVAEAQEKAERIVNEAQGEAQGMIDEAKQKIAQEKQVFESSILQASRQSLEELRQSIEKELFNEALCQQIKNVTQGPEVIAKIINALVLAVEKEGTGSDLSAIIPKVVSLDEVNKFLLEKVLKRLQGGEVKVADFDGGAMVRINDRRIILDLSDQALKELVGNYLRRDFREKLFKS